MTPLVNKGDKFSLNQCPKNQMESKLMQEINYTWARGSLIYLQVYSFPDLAFICCGMLGRYQNKTGKTIRL